MHPVAQALRQIMVEQEAMFFERRQAIEAAVLAVLSKEHLFLLGLPGTAKSMLIRDLVSRFIEALYFEVLMSRTRPDATVLGPFNLPALREHGDFHRKTKGFLPDVNFANIEEIGKMGPTMGHDILGILNERIYHEVNGGRSTRPVPLYTAFTSSNEMIVAESDESAALWDRLLVRWIVDYIQESSNFASFLADLPGDHATRTTIPFVDLADAIDNEVPKIILPRATIDTIIRLRGELRQKEIVVSDRRWRQSVRVLQASAFLNGRSQVEDDDIAVLRYTLWDSVEQLSTVERITLSVSNPTAEKVIEIMDTVRQINKGIADRVGTSLEARASYGTEVNGKIKVMASELGKLRQDALTVGRSTTKIDEAVEALNAAKNNIYINLLDIDPSVVNRAH
jgi:MoxR-like ATPase